MQRQRFCKQLLQLLRVMCFLKKQFPNFKAIIVHAFDVDFELFGDIVRCEINAKHFMRFLWRFVFVRSAYILLYDYKNL